MIPKRQRTNHNLELKGSVAAVVATAAKAINARMDIGADKYDPNDWRGETVARHVRRAVKHAITAMEIADGDRDDDHEDHLAAAVCRLAMAVAVSRQAADM